MTRRADVAVIGAGIVGLAFAWEAARRGRSVVLFEKSPRSVGASVRNFGMVWPIGQPPGDGYARALRSRERWLELRDRAGVWLGECGSLHLAHESDEDAVIREFVATAGPLGVDCAYLPADEATKRFPAIRPTELRSALYSPTELVVNPPEALARIPHFLTETYDVAFHFGRAVIGVDMPRLRTATGETWEADRVFVCSGAEFETLFPDTFASAGIRRCKLQMMKTRPQPQNWRLGPHLAGGLTLCHYKNFEVCRSLPMLKARVRETMPEFHRYGIHVLAAQNDRGEVVIGDSHEYDADISPFDKPEIDGLILNYLQGRMAQLPDWTIAARWHGVYAKHPTEPVVFAEPQSGCVVVAATGGAGMTLAFGIARDWWEVNDR